MYIQIFDHKSLASVLYKINIQDGLWNSTISYKKDSEDNLCKVYEHIDEFVEFFKTNRKKIEYTILIGSKQETDLLIEQMKVEKDEIVFCYDPSIIQPNQKLQKRDNRAIGTQPVGTDLKKMLDAVVGTINDNQQAYYNTIQESIKNLEGFIVKMSQGRIVGRNGGGNELNSINTVLGQISSSVSKIEDRTLETNYYSKELYNQAPNQTNDSSLITKEVLDELDQYKKDFYLKVSQNGVNVSVEMVSMLYEEKYRMEQQEGPDSPSVARMKEMISFCLSRIKGLNVSVKQSCSGDAFDGNTMIAYDDIIETNQKGLDGRVACSITPAFYWTLPRVNAPESYSTLLKEEVVALYKC